MSLNLIFIRKKIIILLILTIILEAKIDFTKHIDTQSQDISLSVTRVHKRDVLNLRLEPSYRSRVIYQIPYDAKNLITHDKDILKKLGKNLWVGVQLGFGEGFYNGWVKAKYLKLYEKFTPIALEDLVVIYPEFLKAKKMDNGWIEIYDRVGFEHYSGCDMRDRPELLDEFTRFDIKLKVYYSLIDVFNEDKTYDNDIYKRVVKYGWFKRNRDGFNRVNLYGLSGYKSSIGVEGCGINRYYFRINGKILVIEEPFDKNLPIPKDNRPIPKDLLFKDKGEIMKYIIQNLRVF